MNNSIRPRYEILGVDDFYKNIGGDYYNPHIFDIKKCIKKCISYGYDDFDNTLDLASGLGEITNILYELGYTDINIIGCDPYLHRQYELKTGNKCLSYSFSDIQKGKLNNFKFDTIICSYALHLAEESIVPELMWNLSTISRCIFIISPNNKPIIKDSYGWDLMYSFKEGKARCRIYDSKNFGL